MSSVAAIDAPADRQVDAVVLARVDRLAAERHVLAEVPARREDRDEVDDARAARRRARAARLIARLTAR